MYQRIINYLDVEIWNLKVSELSKYEGWLVRFLRVITLSGRYFAQDKCAYRASALTFNTLLTIVPVLGMAFGIAKGFGLEAILERLVRDNFVGQEKIMNQILDIVHNLFTGTREEVVAGIGVILLLWSTLRILYNIENTMNVIWRVKRPRTIVRRIVDYSAVLVIAPVLMLVSSGATVFISSIVNEWASGDGLLGSFSPIVTFPLKILPYALIWILLTFLYLVMPNKKVDFLAALIGGIIAGTAYQVTQWGYITFQVGASNMNAIYGSFAAIPLFLIWLQLSWLIVLFGAELCSAIQTVDEYDQRKDVEEISHDYKRLLTIWVTQTIIKRFVDEEVPLNATQLHERLGIPMRLLRIILENLVDCKIISTTPLNKRTAYQPARDIEKLSIHKIYRLIDQIGTNRLNIENSAALEDITKALAVLKTDEKQSDGNLILRNI